jgi:hypothetical protein
VVNPISDPSRLLRATKRRASGGARMKQASQTRKLRISAKSSARNGTELSSRGNMKKFLKWDEDSRCNRVLRDR